MFEFLNVKPIKVSVFIFLGVLTCLFLVLIVSGVINIFNPEIDQPYTNTIAFSGEGRVYIKPDIAFLDLSVVTQGKTVGDVQKKNSEKMNKVIDYLKDFGVEEKDIKTTNYNIYPQYIYEDTKVPQISGYEINQGLEVKIRIMDKIGELLEGAVGAGVNQVGSLRFSVEKDDEPKAEARKLAIEDAKKKARETAAQLGLKLGKLIGFYENYNQPYPVYSAKEGYGVGGGGETPNIQVGENEIYISVSLTYKIK
jgi:hypothetical protein